MQHIDVKLSGKVCPWRQAPTPFHGLDAVPRSHDTSQQRLKLRTHFQCKTYEDPEKAAAEPAEARTTAAENFIFEILERDNYKVGYL
jgi:hypothetical protein